MIALLCTCFALAGAAGSPRELVTEPRLLRLVPFPKEVALAGGAFELDRPLRFQAPTGGLALFAELVRDEFARAKIGRTPAAVGGPAGEWRLSALPAGDPAPAAAELALPAEGGEEAYALRVTPGEALCRARGQAGLLYGLQTFLQLVRANRAGGAVPCLTIRDWPSLRWRCLQDDITRGPCSRLETLVREASLGAAFKLNVFTYYMEQQYAFKKHPAIGPKDGALEPDELRELVARAKALGVEVLGNQQSFGHFEDILEHKEYAHLGEEGYILSPAFEESYRLLDDLYAEEIPLLPFPYFNVCCDETWGLGKGATKPLVEKIGVGGVYVQHILRIHELVAKKYGKRMMMWGDIILGHPEHLSKLPKDIVMLTWGYHAGESFEGQIIPFAKSGFTFWVCPGVSNWSRILPDFGVANINIKNFVRDGVKHGAEGMLNTAWDDDGEALNATSWHGYAWGAECAWNASATSLEDFNRRVGAVLFGEPGDDFGTAIELLAGTHRLAGMDGMNNGRFWADDFAPRKPASAIRTSSGRLLDLVRPAIERLERCKAAATANADLLDAFLLGARRMELIGQRMLDGGAAAQLCTDALREPPAEAARLLERARDLVNMTQNAHRTLGLEFQRLWLIESKPYALDWTTKRYETVVTRLGDIARTIDAAARDAMAGKTVSAESIGFGLSGNFTRRATPSRIERSPLRPESPWLEARAFARHAIEVSAGAADRFDLPVELDLAPATPLAAYLEVAGERPMAIPAQADPLETRSRVVCVIPGMMKKGTTATVWLYMGGDPPGTPAGAVSTSDAPGGMKWIENDKVRLLLGPEGGHIYRWEVKGAGGRDITMPGETGWAGFADMAFDFRSAAHRLACVARGPALVRYECTEPASGLTKTMSLFAGASWIEVVLSEPAGHYWDFDDPRNFAADGPAPGTYLFSDGTTGPVAKESDGVPGQVKRQNVRWGIKFNKDGLALGIATPEVAAFHHIAPGAGAGGVGIENSPPAGHFVTFGGILTEAPGATMARLAETLDFRRQPEVVLHGYQERP